MFPLERAPGALKGGTLSDFLTSIVAKHQKIESPLGFFLKKSLTMPKKTEREDPSGFFNTLSVAKHQKIEGGPIEEKNVLKKKSHNAEKTQRGTL